MYGVSPNIFCIPFFILPMVVLFASDARLAQAASKQHRSTLSPLSIHYEKGVINGQINNAALGDVMRELAAQTGAKIILRDFAIAKHRVSLVVDAMPFELAITQILDDFSYILYHGGIAGLPVVIVLSSGSVAPQEDQAEPIAASITNEPMTGVPAAEQEERETRLEHAVEALRSNQSHEQGAAVYALVASHDQSAMNELVEAASGSGTLNPESQVHVVEVLWRHVADQAFGDELAIDALEQLTQRGNDGVRNVAKQALQDIRHFQEANIENNN